MQRASIRFSQRSTLRKSLARTSATAIGAACFALCGQTELKPQWEIGAGFVAIDFPVYRGARSRNAYVLPFPYAVYRGEKVQINRDGVQGLLFRTGRVHLDLSLNGSIPVSNESPERQGMPDLKPTVEIGPALHAQLLASGDRKTTLDLALPLRSVVATDLRHAEQLGWLFHPQLNLETRDLIAQGWNLGLTSGLIFSDRRSHGYFYDVAPQFATTARPAYAARGGYSGAQLMLTFSQQKDGRWFGGFVKVDDLQGAVFSSSPMVRKKQNATLGFAVTWVLRRSEKWVPVNLE